MPIMRLGWPVAIAMLLVMVSFALSLAYSHLRLRPVGEHVLDVIDNAAPSIDRLSAAHTELGRFGIGVTEYVLRPAHARSVTRQDVVAARQAFAAHFDAYKQLPMFPGEAEAAAALERDLGLLDEATNRALDGADRRSPAAELELHESFYPRLFKLQVALAGLKAINTRNARISAESTLRATQEATFLATVLGVSSLVVAVAAMLLVLRVLRGRARLMHEHAELLAARANELEAFAGRVAHDLKNPLGALALRVLSTVRRPDLSPALHDELDRMTRQIDRMERIIDGLLEFARAGARGPTAGAGRARRPRRSPRRSRVGAAARRRGGRRRAAARDRADTAGV
jgi:signal transduction histidine kinase